MVGDIRNPFNGLNGYQFWAIIGVLTIVVPRVLLAYHIPLGIFTIPLWENTTVSILANDALGFLVVLNAYVTYSKFVNRSTV